MNLRKYWPLDFDPEEEIYESVSWDLPGFRGRRAGLLSGGKRHPSSKRTAKTKR
jgi:hypothetical protein